MIALINRVSYSSVRVILGCLSLHKNRPVGTRAGKLFRNTRRLGLGDTFDEFAPLKLPPGGGRPGHGYQQPGVQHGDGHRRDHQGKNVHQTHQDHADTDDQPLDQAPDNINQVILHVHLLENGQAVIKITPGQVFSQLNFSSLFPAG